MSVTSYIPTAGAAASRVVDSLYWPITFRPQALTVYCRFVDRGTAGMESGSGYRICHIGAANNSAPRLIIYEISGGYRLQHETSIGSVTSTLGATPTPGNVVELVGQLNSNGSVQIHQSINGAAITSATQSAALILATAWSGAVFWLGSISGTISGCSAFLNVEFERGVQTIDTMRRKAGVK